MSDTNAFGYEEGAATAAGVQRGSQAPYKFSPEELRVVQECNAESFLQRSLPLGTSFGLTAYLGVQRGTFKASPRFGAIPKVTLAVIVGYFLGKLSYQQACAEKLMALPNSYIGQLLREKQQGRSGSGPKRTPTMFGATSDDVYSDAGMGSSLDLDTDRPLFNDDSFRPGADAGPVAILPSPDSATSKSTLSYDELRRKNRGEYTDARQDPYKIDPSAVPSVSRTRPAPPQSQSTNKYGDIME